jgi:hypothetical protein
MKNALWGAFTRNQQKDNFNIACCITHVVLLRAKFVLFIDSVADVKLGCNVVFDFNTKMD